MLEKFTILHRDDAQRISSQIPILFNVNHIVSIKPIKMTAEDRKVIDGYWIRLTNGKKYKATQAPQSIVDKLNGMNSSALHTSLEQSTQIQ